jgi:protein-disulfide isomerase
MKKILRTTMVSVCLFAILVTANGQATTKTSSSKAAKNGATPAAVAIADPHDIIEKEILNELRQIRVLLERQQQQGQQGAIAAAVAPSTAQVVAETAKVSTVGFEMGRKDAPITIVEFADYQCPFCRQFNSTVFARLKKDYIDTGKVRFVSRDLPLDFHPNAFPAAEAARCAGEQNKYWEMRDALIARADNLVPEAIVGYAVQLGLDQPRFHACIENKTFSTSIRADADEANAAGITGTPSFVIGPTSAGYVEGEKVIGALPFESFGKIFSKYPSHP